MKIEEVAFAEVAHLRKSSAADRATIRDYPDTRWFAAYRDNMIIGAAGLTMWSGRARIRVVWVRKPQRGHGIGNALVERLIGESLSRVSVIDAFVYNPSYYIRKGFTLISKKPSRAGASKVALVLARPAKIMSAA